MCGIIGIVGKQPVTPALYDALTILQHRGQDAAGIATLENLRIHLFKGNGLVRDVFSRSELEKLRGLACIGHVRYPTAGSDHLDEAQPFYVNSPYGILLGHNGNLINNAALMNESVTLWEVPPDDFSTLIDVNIKGVYHVIRHFVPAMIERGEGT